MSSLHRLREVMDTPVTLKGLTGVFASEGDNEQTVERVLDLAKQRAERSGRPLAAVLAEMGFDVGGTGATVEDDDDGVFQAEAPATPAPAGGAVDARIVAALAPLDAAEVARVMGAVNVSKALARAQFLGWIGEDGAERAGRQVWWQALLAEGVAAGDVADLARVEPWFEPSGEADFQDFMLSSGRVRFRQMVAITEASQSTQRPFWDAAQATGQLDADTLLAAAADFAGVDIATGPADVSSAEQATIDAGWVRVFGIVPVAIDDDALTIASPAMLPESMVRRIESEAGVAVVTQLASPESIAAWAADWTAHWTAHHDVPADDAPMSEAAQAQVAAAYGLPETASRQSAVQLVDQLLAQAIEVGATDVHLEPTHTGARARLRVDGMCHPVLELSVTACAQAIARIKVLADMDVTERRRPQDGQVTVSVGGSPRNLRISTVPASGGEKLAMRLADVSRTSARLEDLGMGAEQLVQVRELTARPFGMILATGPVGSGKTTTLYSCLGEEDRVHGNVMTIEDPVEVQLDGVTQLEVNYGIGFDFVAGLRALLRQDPDTVLVGEIRDEETARISVRASMTGLRVYSTLHTNNATGAVTALRNFHLSSHLLASSIQGVVAQRLLRRVCAECREVIPLTAKDQQTLSMNNWEGAFKNWRGQGCASCMGTGFKGRVGVFEVFAITPQIREMVLSERSETAIRSCAIEQGLITLQQDGLRKVDQGLTSLGEFRRVLNF